MEPILMLHHLEIARRQRPEHRHAVERRRSLATVRRTRLAHLVRATLPARSARSAPPSPQPCGC